MAFNGAFDYSLDAKKRLTVPARFRAALADGIVLAKGFDPCVTLWPAADYAVYVEDALKDMQPLSPSARKLRRYLTANAFATELDAAGRVGMPDKLIAHAGLTKEVVVNGMDQHLEIWDRDEYARQDEALDAEIPDLLARFDEDQ